MHEMLSAVQIRSLEAPVSRGWNACASSSLGSCQALEANALRHSWTVGSPVPMADACRATLEEGGSCLSLFSGRGIAQALLRYRLPPSGSVPELPLSRLEAMFSR